VPKALRRRSPFLLAALCIFAVPAASAGARPAAIDHPSRHGHAHDFERFLQRYEAANTAFVNGDPSLWLPITAEQDPVSIFGGFGGFGEAGIASVHERYLLAATAFRPSGAKVGFQYLVKDVHGRLAYTLRSSAPTSCTPARPSVSRRSCASRCSSAASTVTGRSSTATPTR
jgi:hypothetical protein